MTVVIATARPCTVIHRLGEARSGRSTAKFQFSAWPSFVPRLRVFCDFQRQTSLDHERPRAGDWYLPQRDGGKLVDLVAMAVDAVAAYNSIFERDVQALKKADVLFLLMDGRSIDEGAAFELGYAAALNKLCVGLQTDPRRLLPLGNNPIVGADAELTQAADLR